MTATALLLAAATLAVFAAVGIRAGGGDGSIEDYLTARDSVGGTRLTATLVASGMGVWILLSPPEAGAAFGGVTAVLGYAVGEALPLVAFAVVGPRIRTLLPAGHSLTEYALARFGPVTYVFVLLVSGFYMFIFLAAELTGITSALNLVASVPRWQTALLVGVAVVAYTGYGGLRASVRTDVVQTVLLVPLLVGCLVAAVLAVGGVGDVYAGLVAADPSLVDPGFVPGLTFGLYTSIAVLGAELTNQTWWQRIYAAADEAALRRSFRRAAVVNFVVMCVAGSFGLLARAALDLTVASGAANYDASIAFFRLVEAVFPSWLALGVVVLALALVMSTADSLFSAIASVVTADLPRVLDDARPRTLTRVARAVTVVVAAGAMYVSLRARSVLGLFFLADLLAVAVAMPLVSGLYARSLSGRGALLAGVSGLAVGLAYFPNPLVRGPLTVVPGIDGVLPAPGYFPAFVGTACVTGGLTLAATALGRSRVDFASLGDRVTRFDDAATDGAD